MVFGICIAYDGVLGSGMGDVCLYDSCALRCARKAIAEGVIPNEEENAQARAFRDDMANRLREQE